MRVIHVAHSCPCICWPGNTPAKVPAKACLNSVRTLQLSPELGYCFFVAVKQVLIELEMALLHFHDSPREKGIIDLHAEIHSLN